MHQSYLDKLYNEAGHEKLLRMYDRAEKYMADSVSAEAAAKSIKENLKKSVKHRFGEEHSIEDFDNMFRRQYVDMNKQWQILSASTVKVQRSIKLSDFCSDSMKMCISPVYGIKGHKKFSSWSPFNYLNTWKFSTVCRLSEFDTMLTYGNDILRINKGKYTSYMTMSMSCDFKELLKIPQLDHTKVKMLMLCTGEFVEFIRSWILYWEKVDRSKSDQVIQLENYGGYRAKSGTDYRKLFLKINELLEYKFTLKDKVEVHFREQDLVVQKWRDINKNFLVLNELAKRRLEV